MKLIREIELSDKKLQLKIGKAYHTISLGDSEKEYPTNEFTLQEVEKEFTSLLNQNSENVSSVNSVEKGLGYVSQKVMRSDALRIKSVLQSTGLRRLHSFEDFHFTLFYDKRNPVIEINEMARQKFLSASVVGIELLAPDTPTPALALTFKSEDLNARVDELTKLGFECDFPEFLAHVTIKYNPEEGDLELLQKSLPLLLKEIGDIQCGYESWRIAKV